MRYPTETVLRDGRRVLIRPFRADDASELSVFYEGLPASWRRFAWEPLEDTALVERWADNIDYDKTLPLLALDGSRIVAEAVLKRREFGPLRLVGRIKWLLDPAHRGVGLGAMMVNLLIDEARSMGLRHLTCMLISDLEQDAIDTLLPLGFVEYRIAGYGVDPDGATHDMSKLVFSL